MLIKLQSRQPKDACYIFTLVVLALCLISAQSHEAIKSFTPSIQERTAQVYLNCEAALLLTDSQGRKFGFETKQQRVVNGVPGASINYQKRFPAYLLPSDTSGKPYTILIPGQYRRHDISFGLLDNYLMEYGQWDGHGPACFKK